MRLASFATRCMDTLFTSLYVNPYLGLIAYIITAPLAEWHFHSLVKRHIKRRSMQKHAVHSSTSDAAEALKAWELQLLESTPQQIDALFRGWFFGSGEPRHGNVVEMFCWMIHNLDVAECTAEQRCAVDALIGRIEGVRDCPFPPGREPNLKVMSYTLDPWAVRHKPLIAYLLLGMARSLLASVLTRYGYEKQRAGRLEFYCRPAPDPCRRPRPPVPPPIVLMHGVLGILPYAMLLRLLALKHTGAILVPLFPHASISLEQLCDAMKHEDDPHDGPELVAALRTMIARHSPPATPPKAAFIAHSLGSGMLAPLMRTAPELIAAAAFIDPICFLLHDGAVLKNFMYSAPPLVDAAKGVARAASDLDLQRLVHSQKDVFHWCQRHIVASEPTMQENFRRCFWWTQHWLHPSEIGCDAIVHLSGQDSIVDASKILHYLQSYQR